MRIFENGLDMLAIVWSLGCAVVGCTFGIAKAAENQRQRFLHRNLTRPPPTPREDEQNPNNKVAVPKIFTSANKSGHILEIQQRGGLLKSRAGLSWWGTVLLCITGINTQGEDGSSTHIPLIYYIPKMMLNETIQWGQPCTIPLHMTFYESQQKRVCDTISSVLFMRLR